MPNLKDKLYQLTNNTKTNHYIETGTYLGHGIITVLNSYEHIHSIELSEQWYVYNIEQFKHNHKVHMYCGDSKKVLPELLKNINEPVTVYLDAHYSGGPTAFGEEETPLLFELDVLKQREYDDIIIVDDCRLLGKSGTCGAENHPIYPPMNYDWSNITEQRIRDRLKPGYVLLKNDNCDLTDGNPDQYILVKQK